MPGDIKEFFNEFGVKPHSNLSAMFAEGGIWGLYMWVMVFVIPIYSLTLLFLKRRLDPMAIVVLCSGVSMLVLQSTLNVPFFKQPWLWAGAVVGTLVRAQSQDDESEMSMSDVETTKKAVVFEKKPSVILQRKDQ